MRHECIAAKLSSRLTGRGRGRDLRAVIGGPLRVVHVIPSINRSDGGPSEVVLNLVPELNHNDVEAVVVSTDKGLSSVELAGLPFLPVLGKSRRFLRRMNFATGLIRPLLRTIGQADVVHVHGVDTYIGTLAMLAAALKRKPVVLEPHGALSAYQARLRPWRKVAYRILIDRWNYRRVAALVVSSKMEADEAAGVFSNVKTFVVPLGVDDEILRGDSPDCNERHGNVLFLGRITEKKRLDLLMEAASLMPDSATRIVVAGPVDPALAYSPTARAERLGIQSRVDFLGAVDRRRRFALLRAARAFVLLSDDESFGIAAAEAMAAGCPAVLSRRVGLVSNLSNEAGAQPSDAVGFVVCDQDAATLAGVLSRLLSDVHYWRAVSAAGRTAAQRHFQWGECSRLIAGAYREIASMEVRRAI